MSTSFAILGILSQQPNYGYELKRNYDKLFGKEKPLAFGQVYATLNRLLRDQKIATSDPEQTTGPERKKYTLTKKGRAELEAWLTLPSNHSENRPVLFTKVITAILLDASPNDYLDLQQAAHLAKMRELTALRKEGDLTQQLQADYELYHLEGDLRWISNTAARLDALSKEIREG